MTAQVIKFPRRKRIVIDDYRLTPDQVNALDQWATQTLEEVEAEIMQEEFDNEVARVLRMYGLIP